MLRKEMTKQATDLVIVFQAAIIDIVARMETARADLGPQDQEDAQYTLGVLSMASVNCEAIIIATEAEWCRNETLFQRYIRDAQTLSDSLVANGYGIVSPTRAGTATP